MGRIELTQKAITVIFARGSGDVIPLFSARILAGKPMLHYTIQAALRSARIDGVYVSTEDERIAAVARAGGAQVIMRPETLSQRNTPIRAAVDHSARFLHDHLASVGGTLLCLPADAVFCDTALIDQALETYFAGNHDQLLALLPENKKYVIWKEVDEQRLEPVILPPDLRPESERLLSDPGVLTVWGIENGRLRDDPSRVGYIALDDLRAFRVDTEYDLAVAERLIAPHHLALRCDGSKSMGMGHIVRLLSIAEDLHQNNPSEWVVRFFVGSDHLEGAQTISERGFDVEIVRQHDYAHWARRIEDFRPMVVVTDLPFVPSQYTEQLRHLPAKSLTLVDSVADIEPGSRDLDTVVSLLDEDLAWPHEVFHRGPAFATFHPSVVATLQGRTSGRERPDKLQVLVAFGTGDPERLTQTALSALAESSGFWQGVTVLVRPEQQDAIFWDKVGAFSCPVEVIDAPSEQFGKLLDMSDLALVSGGVTAYEASALGVPAIVLCQNQRELHRMEQFERLGSVLLLGLGSQVTEAQLSRTLNRIAADVPLWKRMSSAGQQTTDGRGVERISKIVRDLFSEQRAAAVS